jgi:hypothetical protein
MEAIIASLVGIPKCMMEAVVIMLMWARIRLGKFDSSTAKFVLVGEKLILFGKYILNFYLGIVHDILREPKTWCTKIYLPTQCTNWQILTSAKKIQF